MEIPLKAGNCPAEVQLKKDYVYSWCACSLSFNQPFCDGEHIGTNFKPKVFKVENSGNYSLCMCKRTKSSPFCDCSHKI